MKRILLSLMSLSIVATSATSLVACKQTEQFDFPGNNQFAKTASPVVIAKVNNFLQYSFVYTEKDGKFTFEYSYQDNPTAPDQPKPNQWPKYDSMEQLNPWGNDDFGTTAANTIAVAVYAATTIGNTKHEEAGVQGCFARIMPNPEGELLQLKQASLPTNEFMNESMIAKAKANADMKKILQGYYLVTSKAPILVKGGDKANPDDYANFFWSAAILPISNINSNIL
ncbi:hypothetical protein [Spiroplasma sp. DGKH1]|uniref:hypothetical protein n=1 Tax=Spiroplasma sp. DGKH1 TaxID=3050074 RepID=UPI0034C62C2F